MFHMHSRRFQKLCALKHKSRTFLRQLTATTDVKDDYSTVGKELHGYTILQSVDVPDFHAHATLLHHNQTGAQHLHVSRDDQNNVFGVAFRTTPLDHSGVPHILEHTVLCGSKLYPCRDPFFKMLNRSLSTFMNAFTASDWTLYPFSTQHPKDFYNLMSVYLDAAFHPNLTELDFRQEGWRLEHEDLNDVMSAITLKGVVFNEMKGALSSSDSIYQTLHQNLLLPNHTYSYCSGGDPLHIPTLSYEKLKEFHTSHYHPSNARFYTYGSFPLESHLSNINKLILKNFSKIDPKTEIPIEPKWKKPRSSHISCPVDPLTADPDKQTTASVSYMLNYIEDSFEIFTLAILSALMISGPNSPFYQALREINIGSDYSPSTGLDTSIKHPTFSVGLQGLHRDDVQRVLKLVEETFEKITRDGFEPDRIESILHNVEISQKHQTSNFGLSLLMAIIGNWNQDKNPIDYLFVNEQVERFKQTLSDNPRFLQDKVLQHFVSNTHKLTLVMEPDAEYNAKKQKCENELLSSMLIELDEKQKKDIYTQGLELQACQNAIEDTSVLPKMLVSEIDRKLKATEVEINTCDNVDVYTCQQPTNGIAYFRSIITTSSLPFVVKPYLPLFCNVLTRLGAGNRDYKELAQAIELNTGGLSAGVHLITSSWEPDTFEQGILLSSHCLDRNIPMMFSLWQDILNEPLFKNPDRLRTLINSLASDLAVSVAHSGHIYAMACSAQSLTPATQLGELFGGLKQVEFMRDVAERGDVENVIENLMTIATYLCNSNEMRCALNTTSQAKEASMLALNQMLTSLNTVGFDDPDTVEDLNFKPKSVKTYVEMDLPVNYVSRSVRGVVYSHEDHAKLRVLLKLLSAKFLHQEIREKGGAYGAGAKIDAGVISFYSFRDPNSLLTLDSFKKSSIWASEGRFNDDDIEEAKLAVFAAVDSPVSPANRGMTFFQGKLTNEMRQMYRDRLFAVTRHDLVNVAQRYLLPGQQVESFAVIGPKNETLSQDETWRNRTKIAS